MTVSFLDDLEKRIRDNRAPRLNHLVKSVSPNKIPRHLLARYASLVRRLGGLEYAVKILNPVIRNAAIRPNENEIIEYASCLTRLQLCEESIELLKQIRGDSSPEVFYELAAAHVNQWNYPAAIPYFKKYLESPLPLYKKFVGQINLGASYIYVNDFKKAQAVLEDLVREAQRHGFKLLAGNACELLGEIAIIKKDFKKAYNILREAKSILSQSIARYDLYVDKWVVVGRMLEQEGSSPTLREFSALRKKVAELREWNTLKELEMFRAIAAKDSGAIEDLYFGVPYEEFRKRILFLWGKAIPQREFYERKMGPGRPGPKDLFDLRSGRDLKTGAKLKPGQTLQRMMLALTTDFYAPFTTTKLFSIVFKGTRFNPQTSPQQVYEVIKRLNTWLQKNKIPLKVLRGKGGYRLRANQAYVLRIPTDFKSRSKMDEFLEQIRNAGFKENFTVKMVEAKLNLPRRTITRLLAEAVKEKQLTRKGHTQSTTYHFVSR